MQDAGEQVDIAAGGKRSKKLPSITSHRSLSPRLARLRRAAAAVAGCSTRSLQVEGGVLDVIGADPSPLESLKAQHVEILGLVACRPILAADRASPLSRHVLVGVLGQDPGDRVGAQGRAQVEPPGPSSPPSVISIPITDAAGCVAGSFSSRHQFCGSVTARSAWSLSSGIRWSPSRGLR
jgi:hypothetical protein